MMKKVMKTLLALAMAFVCGGAWAEEHVLVSDTHLTTSDWVDTNWTVDSLDELMSYSYYGTMAGGSIADGTVAARGYFVRKEGPIVTVQMQVHQNKASDNNYLKVAKLALTLDDDKHVLVKGVAAGYISGGPICTEIVNWNGTFGSSGYGVNNLKADKLPLALSKPGLKMWLDASDSSTITLNEENKVTKWVDKSGHFQDATPSAAYIMVDGVKTEVTRYASVATVNGNTAIQMGEVASGIDLAFTQMTDIRTVFWVMDIKRNGNAFFLADSGTYHFHRNVNQYVNGNASAYVRGGSWKCDGLMIKPQNDETPAGHHVYSLVTTGNVTANSLSQDRDVKDQRNGGRAISELIVFNRALSAAEVAEVEAYLANKWTIIQSSELAVTEMNGSATKYWSDVGTKSNVTLNVTDDATLSISGDKDMAGRFVINVAPGKTLTMTSGANPGKVLARGGVIITGGGTVTTPLKDVFRSSSVRVDYPSVLEFTETGDKDDSSTDCSRIQGTGTIRYKQTAGFRTLANSMWAKTLCFEAEAPNSAVIVNKSTTTPTEIGTLSGTKGFRSDWDSGDRILRVTQAHNSIWSGKFNNDDRVAKMVVAGAAGAAEKTLTIAGTHDQDNNLEVEPTGSVKLTGTWKGATETISGEFGGSGSITGASTITVNNGAKIRADWGAVTANVAPTFASGAVIEVVTESIPAGNKIKLFSGSGFTASENVAKARILSTAGEVLSFGTVAIEADGVYAIASAETKNPTLYYGYAMTGSTSNMIVKEEDASNQLTKGGDFVAGDFSDNKLSLGSHAGSHWGTGSPYPQGDFTMITLVKTPSNANKTIFSMGGESGTTGLVGLRYAGGNSVRLFTKSGEDLASVFVENSANTFHVYTIKYSKSTGTIQLAVDKGPYTDPVAFTTGNTGDWQFGGIYRGGIDGFAENADGGQMGEFRVYASQLTDAERDAFVDEFATPVAKIGDEKYFSLGEACEAAAQLSEKVTITLVANSSENVKLAANTTLDPGNYTYSGILMGSGTYILAYTGTTQPSAPNGVATKVWTGTVWIKGDGTNNNINDMVINNFANGNSKLAFTGLDGYFNSAIYNGGTIVAKSVELIDDGDTKALTIDNGAAGNGFLIKKLIGEGTLQDRGTSALNGGICIGDASEFEGNLTAATRAAIKLGVSKAGNGTAKTIEVHGAALLANGKSWTASSGITIKSTGVIKGSGTIKSATTFEDGATIDLSKGAMTLEAVANFVNDGTLKVKGANLAGSKLFTVPAEQNDSPDYVKLIVDEEEIIGVAYQESATDIYVAKAVATISDIAFRTIDDALETIAVLQAQQPDRGWSITDIEVLDSSAVTNPYYTVVDGHLAFAPAIAKIDEDHQYPTLALALSAATSGDKVTLLSACAENVTIPANVTVETTNTAAFAGTINGEGIVVYNANKTKTDPTFTLGSTWTGTVWVKNWGTYRASDNLGNDNAAFIANMGRSGSTLKLSGVTGWYTGNEITFDICLENGEDDRAFGWENSSGSSSGESVFKSFTGSGLYRDTFACTQKILIKDVSKFFGSFSLTGKRVTLGGTTQQADANGQIFVAAGATVMLDQASTWTANGGIKIAGTIGGSGTLASATTFSDGATIDLSEGSLTASGTVTFGNTLKVTGTNLAEGDTVLTVANFTGALPALSGNFSLQYVDGAIKLAGPIATVMVNGEEYKFTTIANALEASVRARVPAVLTRDYQGNISMPAGAVLDIGSYTITGSVTFGSGAYIIENGKPKVNGFACQYDWTFTSDSASKNSKSIAAVYPTSGANLTGDSNAAYTRQDNQTQKYMALKTEVRPYRDMELSKPFTVAVAGCLPSSSKTCFVSFGSSTNGIFIGSGANEGEIAIYRIDGNCGVAQHLYQFKEANVTTLKTEKVSNGSNAQHTIVFSTEDMKNFKLYLDGRLWSTYPFDTEQSIANGLQVGGWYGGSAYDGSYNQANSDTAPNSYVSAIRVYNYALADEAVKAFAEEFPYVSPSGISTRTLTENDETWESEDAWSVTPFEQSAYSSNKAIDGSKVELTTTQGVETTLDIAGLTASVNYESITIEGSGSIIFKNTAGNRNVVSCNEANINAAITINEGSLDLANGVTTIGEHGKITLDFSSLTEAAVAAHPIAEKITGLIDADPNIGNPELAKIVVKKPSDERINVRLEHIDGCYWVKADGVGFKGTSVGDENGVWDYSNTLISNSDIKTGDKTYTRTIGSKGFTYTLGALHDDIVISMMVDMKANNGGKMLVSVAYGTSVGEAQNYINLLYTQDEELKLTKTNGYAEEGTAVSTDSITGKHLVEVSFSKTNGVSVKVDGDIVANDSSLGTNESPCGVIRFGSHAADGKADWYVANGTVYYSINVDCSSSAEESDVTEQFSVPAVFAGSENADKAQLIMEFLDADGQVVIPGAYKVDGGAVITNPAEIRELASLIGNNDCSSAVNFAMPFVAPEQTTDANTMKIAINLSHDVTGNVTLCVGTSPDGANTVVDTKSNPEAGTQTFTLDSISSHMGEGKVLYFKVKATPAQAQ